jgi:predicted TIM-barrel fold metal-dependent hydrolase
MAHSAVATGIISQRLAGAEAPAQSRDESPLIWDAHGHLNATGRTPTERIQNILRSADRIGIERVIVFMGYPWAQDPTPDEFRRQNDQVIEAVENSDGRALGFVYLNPKHTDASLAELRRCVRDGPLVGVKLWVAVRCHEPCLDPIVAHATALRVPVLQHTWHKMTGNLPGESTAEDLAQLAARHPQATFIAAHTGGDWECGIRSLRNYPNVVAEICGSDPTAGFVEMAVRELGAERVIYGSDFPGRSFASQLAKVLAADIPHHARQLILSGNIRRILTPILQTKGISS